MKKSCAPVSNFSCKHPSCGKMFKERSNLKNHMRVHSNETPYKCSFPGCGKLFKWRSSLRYHRCRSHQPPDITNPIDEGHQKYLPESYPISDPVFSVLQWDSTSDPNLTDFGSSCSQRQAEPNEWDICISGLEFILQDVAFDVMIS
jgi:hypothetical protein